MKINSNIIGIGDEVKVTIKGLKKTIRQSLIIEEFMQPRENSISVNSPVGQALLGKKVGDISEYRVGHRKFNIEIHGIIKN